MHNWSPQKGGNLYKHIHWVTTARKANNHIKDIFTQSGNWVSNFKEIGNVLLNHFKTLFNFERTNLQSLKASGSDGFLPRFYPKFWNLIMEDVYHHLIYYFLNNEVPLEAYNKTILTLISTSNNPCFSSDLRPISLSKTTYKIPFKIICNRLQPTLFVILPLNQRVFIKGRDS